MHYFTDKPYHLSAQLINWYHLNKRDLPWRFTKDPYKIWLSEIILQQTRVDQGTAYYLKFVRNYPDVKALAKASEEEILKDWQGLGYYSRARNLHATAKFIYFEQKGVFPTTYDEIIQLKGVGEYTAAAIASFSFKLKYAVVDGNVYRVLSRIFGISTPIDSTTGKKEFKMLAQQLLNPTDPATHNQAIMEFGALQCIPKNPNCSICPIRHHCIAYLENQINKLPIKAKKLAQKNKFLNYLIITNDQEIVLNYRNAKGIWQNLYDFPLIETNSLTTLKELKKLNAFHAILKTGTYREIFNSDTYKHVLSHQILHARFFHFNVKNLDSEEFNGFEKVEIKNLSKKPIPKLIENYLNQETNLLSLFGS